MIAQKTFARAMPSQSYSFGLCVMIIFSRKALNPGAPLTKAKYGVDDRRQGEEICIWSCTPEWASFQYLQKKLNEDCNMF